MTKCSQFIVRWVVVKTRKMRKEDNVRDGSSSLWAWFVCEVAAALSITAIPVASA